MREATTGSAGFAGAHHPGADGRRLLARNGRGGGQQWRPGFTGCRRNAGRTGAHGDPSVPRAERRAAQRECIRASRRVRRRIARGRVAGAPAPRVCALRRRTPAAIARDLHLVPPRRGNAGHARRGKAGRGEFPFRAAASDAGRGAARSRHLPAGHGDQPAGSKDDRGRGHRCRRRAGLRGRRASRRVRSRRRRQPAGNARVDAPAGGRDLAAGRRRGRDHGWRWHRRCTDAGCERGAVGDGVCRHQRITCRCGFANACLANRCIAPS